MSDQVLKRCREHSTTNPDKKKLKKITASLRKLVRDPEVRREAEKKGRTASESSFIDEDSSTTKSSRMTSPPLK